MLRDLDYNIEAVWRKRGSNSSERQCGFSSFVPRIKCSESPAFAKPPGDSRHAGTAQQALNRTLLKTLLSKLASA